MSAFLHGFAGCAAGMVSAATFFPLDLVKTRHQASSGSNKSKIIATAQQVVRKGGFRALYSGLSVNLYGSGMAWGMYFFGYNFMQTQIRQYQGRENLSSAEYFLAANTTGATVCVVTNPIWVVKTRMQLQDSGKLELQKGSRSSPIRYANMWDGIYKLARYEGISGLSRGLVPNLFNVIHGSIHIACYEWCRKMTLRHLTGDGDDTSERGRTQLSAVQTMGCAAAAKTFALVTTYPLQVFRTRQHQAVPHKVEKDIKPSKHYDGMAKLAGQILRREGIRGFYKGVKAASIREIPATCVTFLVYESIKKFYLARL